MGMILECYAVQADVDADRVAPDRIRDAGMLVGSVSINSSAVEVLLGPLAAGPLAGFDFAAGGPAGVLFQESELANLGERMTAAGIDADVANAILDAIGEAEAQRAALWIGIA